MENPTKALLVHYDEAYQRARGEKALINWAKDGALAKKLLAVYPLDKLCAWVDHFFVMEDQFIAQSGYTFGVFYACLGKVIADRQPTRPVVSAKNARSFKAIYGE